MAHTARPTGVVADLRGTKRVRTTEHNLIEMLDSPVFILPPILWQHGAADRDFVETDVSDPTTTREASHRPEAARSYRS